MKKFTLLLSSVFCYGVLNAQIYDNGPLVNSPGAGAGGADVSNTHDGLVNYGFNHSLVGGYRVADDFIVPSGETWTIDSIVFFAYQTNSGNTSSIAGVSCAVYDGSPAAAGSIILGDETTNIMSNSYWSGIYRASDVTLTSTLRPIMRDIIVPASAWVLTAGSYWLSWQTDGSASFSGPWCPPITLPSVTATGDAIQEVASAWQAIIDTAQAGVSDDVAQGLPFQIYGSISTGISEHANVNGFSITNIYPVPVIDEMSFILNAKVNGTVGISLNDFLGREIFSQEKNVIQGRNKININLSGYSAGVYFLTIKNNTATAVSKLIKY